MDMRLRAAALFPSALDLARAMVLAEVELISAGLYVLGPRLDCERDSPEEGLSRGISQLGGMAPARCWC